MNLPSVGGESVELDTHIHTHTDRKKKKKKQGGRRGVLESPTAFQDSSDEPSQPVSGERACARMCACAFMRLCVEQQQPTH